MTNPNQIQSLVFQVLRLAKVPYIDPCTGLLVGDCNDTCGSGGSGGPTTNIISFNPTTNEITTVVNGVSSTTILNLDSGDVVTTSSITVDGTPFVAGTSLQTIVNAIAAKTHVPAVLTNTNAAFSWNTVTQVGNIPLSSSLVDNGNGTATFTRGDGSAPVIIPLGSTETAADVLTTVPVIIDGTTYPVGTSVEAILVDLQNSINFNVSTGPDGVVANATQTVTINPGDNIHFYSSNSTIDFDVTLGSAVVDGKVINLFTTAPITVQGVPYVAGTSVFTILAALTSGSTPTVSDTGTIDLTLLGNDISGIIVGSDTALAGQVPQSDGAGSLTWVTPTSSTNLTYTASPTQGIVNSDTGTDATIPVVDAINAGLATPAMFVNSHVPATVTDSASVDLTITGQDIIAVVSGADSATNGQVPQSDGAGGLVWVTPSAGHIAATVVDSPSIDFTASGVDNQTFTAIVVGADTAVAGQLPSSDGAGGLTWITPTSHVPVTAVDSNTVDFTQSGIDNQTITADVKISNTTGNDITSDANGLFLDVQASETTTSITGTVIGHTIGTYINEDAVATNINETVTTLVAAPDGFEYTNEDGTVSTITYLFDNTTPSAPVLLVQVDGTTQASIPLNSYDVNITTTGGFAFNPLTDVITITETDGETHTIDLTPLRTTVTSTDNSVGIAQSVNPDGSTNYDLGVKSHSNETQAVSYTGVELPVITGVNIGDTVTTNFTNGVAHYTFNGTNWVLNFFVPAGFAIDTLCDTTGTPVIVFADENGNLSYKNTDNTPYTGDPNLLESCCCTVSPIVSADANNDITIGSDGGAFYNATIAVHSNEIQATPYTGVELPLTSGINVGDTKTVGFNDGSVVNYTWDGSSWILDFVEEPEVVGTITISDEDGNTFIQDNNSNAVFPLDRTLHVRQGLVGNLAIGVSSQDSDQSATGNVTTNHTNVVSGSTLSSAAGTNNMVTASNFYSEIYGGSENFIAANNFGWLLPSDTRAAIISSQNSPSIGNNAWAAHIAGVNNTWSNVRNSIVSGSSNTYNNVNNGSFTSGFANIQTLGQITSSDIISAYTNYKANISNSFIAGGGIFGRETNINGDVNSSFLMTSTDNSATLPTEIDLLNGVFGILHDTRHTGSFQSGSFISYKSTVNSPISQSSNINIQFSNIDADLYSANILGNSLDINANVNQSSIFGTLHTVNVPIFKSQVSGSNTVIDHSGVFVHNVATSVLTTNATDKGYFGLPNGMDIYTNNALTLGVTLAANGTSWASISDVNKKKNFKSLDYSNIYERFKSIDIQTWEYRDSDDRHIGITAQDFYKVLGENVGSDSLKIETIDADGLALALIKKLQNEVEILKEKLNSLININK